MESAAEVRARWLSYLHSTEPADRPRAETAVRALYAAAGFPEPRHLLWFDSPCAASWALAALVPAEDRVSGPLLAANVLSKDERAQIERTRALLCERLGVAHWNEVVASIGEGRSVSLQSRMDPARTFAPALLEARYAMVDDISSLFAMQRPDDDLARAESHFWGPHWGVLTSAVHCPRTDFLIRRSFYDEHTFSMLADDDARAGEREAPAILRAIGEIARSAGLWWPYEHAAILCDRPAELHVDERRLPHREDGPAVVFRDGWQLFAWKGKAVPMRWIMHTESVPPGEYKGFDPTFRAWAKSRSRPAAGTKKRAKRASILQAALPADPAMRLEQLRAHAGGRLPLHDRYVAGEHEKVWKELVALGAEVRADPHAADALAVAYETMRRVDANVRTLVERLAAMNYVFTGGPGGPSTLSTVFDTLRRARDTMLGQRGKARPGRGTERAHVPPGPDAPQRVAEFEREFGTLPLSLRAFHEVVGEVNLAGRHPAIDPPGNPIAPDPLMVYGLEEGAVEHDDDDEGEGEGKPTAIVIAPDDLHKANTSGGDAYEMAIPDLRADGELVNERHGLFFVDYLRLCFVFGGFPGYEGTGTRPAELSTLSAGLLDF